MGWWRRVIELSRLNPKDVIGQTDRAERLSGQGRGEPAHDVAELGDRDVIQGWLRQLGPQGDQQVLVHRRWGTVVAVADGRSPVSVFWTDGDTTWYAVPPGVPGEQDLESQQVEHVVLDALTSPGPPSWPDWRVLL